MKALKQFQTPAGRMYLPGDKIDGDIDAPTARHYLKFGMVVGDVPEEESAKGGTGKKEAGKKNADK